MRHDLDFMLCRHDYGDCCEFGMRLCIGGVCDGSLR